MKRTVLILLLVAALLLAGSWMWRYTTLNWYYESINSNTQIIYSIGENIPFGQDYIDYQLVANGYSVCIEHFDIIDANDLFNSVGIDPTQLESVPDRIALVSLTVMNDGSTDEGVPLEELELFGIDEWMFLEYELLDLMNPGLEGNSGISLADGTNHHVILPYGLYKNRFSNHTWTHMDKYRFFFATNNASCTENCKASIIHTLVCMASC